MYHVMDPTVYFSTDELSNHLMPFSDFTNISDLAFLIKLVWFFFFFFSTLFVLISLSQLSSNAVVFLLVTAWEFLVVGGVWILQQVLKF